MTIKLEFTREEFEALNHLVIKTVSEPGPITIKDVPGLGAALDKIVRKHIKMIMQEASK